MSTRTPTLGRGLMIGGATVVALVLLPEPQATAHAVFVSATPGPGTTWSIPPPSVRMEFSEPLDAGLSGIDVYGSSGHVVPTRSIGVDPADPRAYAVALPRLRPDRYTIIWHTVSAVDGHSRRGSYTFTVDLPDGSAPKVRPGVTPAPGGRGPPTSEQALVRWTGLAGLFLLAGSMLVAALGSGVGVLGLAGTWRRLRLLSLVGCGALLTGTVGDLISAWVSAGRSAAGLAAILSTSAGRWWVTRLVVLAVVIYAFPRSTPDRPTATRRFVLATAFCATVLSFAATSHGAAAVQAGAGLVYEFVHILAASVWLGGAAALAAVWTAARQSASAERRRLLHRYSIAAGIAVPAVILSGLGNAALELGSLGDLVNSSYGAALLVKSAALLVLIAVAAVNAIVLKPAFDSGRPRGRRLDRTIAIEAVLGFVVLVPTAVLAVLAPSRPTDSARSLAASMQAEADPANTFSGSTRLDGRAVAIELTPGALGTNAARVEVAGVYTAQRLRLAASGAGGTDTANLVRTGLDHDPATHTIYQGSLQLTHAGVRQAILHPADDGTPSVPILIPVSKRAPAGFAAEQSPGPTMWLGIIALTGLAAVLIAAARAFPIRRLKSVAVGTGAAGLSVAVVWAGIVTIGTPPDAPRAAWGEVRPATSVALTDARVWQVPTPAAGLMMPAVAPDGSVWVAEMGSNKLARLDPSGNVVQEFRFPGAEREPMGVAVAPDGRVWLAQEHAMALGVFDPARGRYREFHIPGGVSAPLGIVVSADGEVWFTESSGNRIGRFDPLTARFTQYSLPTSDATPYWLALDATGTVWFTEFAAGKVGSLDPRTGHVREYAVPGTPNVAGITVADDGTVWFVTCQGALFALTPPSGRLRRISLPIAGDYGVAVSPDGHVWVGRDGGRTVFAIDPETGRSHDYRLPAGSAPWWPVVDRRGHVWVALTGDRGNGLAELHHPA